MDKVEPLPFFVPAGRIAVIGTILLPAAAIVALFMVRRNDLEDSIEMGGALRIALLIHAVYFSVLPLMFEAGLDISGALLDKMGLNSFGHVPANPDNLYWQMTHLAGELFFVATVTYFVMAGLSTVPRWTLIVPLAQVAYNLKNSLVWLVLYKFFSPTRSPNYMMISDFLVIFPFAVIYTLSFLGDKVKQA